MIFTNDELNKKLKVMFEDYFVKSKYYTGENCSPKYETYRIVYDGWLQGVLSMLKLVDSETYYSDYVELCFYSNSFCDDLLSSELAK